MSRSRAVAVVIAASLSALTLAVPGVRANAADTSTTVSGTSTGRTTGDCVIDVPPADQTNGIRQIIVRNPDGNFSVVFVDGSATAADFQPCFPGNTSSGGTANGTTTTVLAADVTATTAAVSADVTTPPTTSPDNVQSDDAARGVALPAPASSNPSATPAKTLAQAKTDPSTLAFTGADIAEMTAIGLVLIGIGGASFLARRRTVGNHSK